VVGFWPGEGQHNSKERKGAQAADHETGRTQKCCELFVGGSFSEAGKVYAEVEERQ